MRVMINTFSSPWIQFSFTTELRISYFSIKYLLNGIEIQFSTDYVMMADAEDWHSNGEIDYATRWLFFFLTLDYGNGPLRGSDIVLSPSGLVSGSC